MGHPAALFYEVTVFGGLAVLEEAPGLHGGNALVEVDIGDHDRLLAAGKFGCHLAPGVHAEAPAVERDPVLLSHAVDPEDEQVVGEGIGAYRPLPETVRLDRCGCWREHELGAPERKDPAALGKEVVPADLDADPALRRLENGDPGISGGKIELFAIEGKIGKMQFAVDAEQFAAIKDRGAVEVFGADGLEERDNEHGPGLLGNLLEPAEGLAERA